MSPDSLILIGYDFLFFFSSSSSMSRNILMTLTPLLYRYLSNSLARRRCVRKSSSFMERIPLYHPLSKMEIWPLGAMLRRQYWIQGILAVEMEWYLMFLGSKTATIWFTMCDMTIPPAPSMSMTVAILRSLSLCSSCVSVLALSFEIRRSM